MGPANALRLAFIEALEHRRGDDPALGGFVAALSATECLERDGAIGAVPDHAAPHLDEARENLACEAPLAGAIRDFADLARWYRILDGAEVDPGLVAGMLVGRPDLPAGAAVRMGLFLIAPGVLYPPHQHAAEEIYFVASGRLEIRHGRSGAPFGLGPGDYSVTPCNRVHALQTGERPCLILYVWTGRLAEPSWWWAEDGDGWHRTRWDREDSGRWYRLATEPVTAAILDEAGESA